MKKCLYIGIFGFCGALLRFYIEQLKIMSFEGVAINTLIINTIGSFLISIIYTSDKNLIKFNDNIKVGVTTGFLGGFTTFSTLCKESGIMISKGMFFEMVTYICISVILGILGALLGEIIMEHYNRIRINS